MSTTDPCMPKFKAIAPVGASRQMGEILGLLSLPVLASGNTQDSSPLTGRATTETSLLKIMNDIRTAAGTSQI